MVSISNKQYMETTVRLFAKGTDKGKTREYANTRLRSWHIVESLILHRTLARQMLTVYDGPAIDVQYLSCHIGGIL